MKISIMARLWGTGEVWREIEAEMVGEQVALSPAVMATVDGVEMMDHEWSVTHVKSGRRVGGLFLEEEAARDWARLLGAVDLDAFWEGPKTKRDYARVRAQVDALKGERLERWHEELWWDV